MRIGAHVPPSAPLATAAADGLDCLQLFLGNPQSWKKPAPRADAADLRAADLPVYVHAPYLVNVASAESRIRIPSRRILQETCDAAAEIGAAAVIVHGGTVTGDEPVAAAYPRWRKALEQLDSEVPVLIENTAGGDSSVARLIGHVGELFDAVGDLGPGFCLDTCHAHSAGIDVAEAAEAFRAATGRIDLLHCNDSRDPLGSGRDRHTTVGRGTIPREALLGAIRAAGVDVVLETPDGGRAEELSWLRRELS